VAVEPIAPAAFRGIRFQRQKRAWQFVRIDDVAPTIVAMGINNPTPIVMRDSAAITPGPSGS